MFIKLTKIKLKKGPKKALKSLAVFLLVTSWLLTGYPGFWLPDKDKKLVRFPEKIERVYAGQQAYTTGSGNFTPTVTGNHVITLVGGGGGGGGGGGSNKNGGGGGGGGGLCQVTVSLTSGNNYAYSVGSAGSAGVGDGGNGGNTTFVVGATTYTGTGGGGGLDYNNGGTGGTGGVVTGCTLNNKGGNGATGIATGSGGGGSGAGTSGAGNNGTVPTGGAAVTSYGGKGGNGSTANAGPGVVGEAYGGGGGGATKTGLAAAGYAGYIIITWTDPPTTTLGDGADPTSSPTVAPGATLNYFDAFTFINDQTTDTISGLTVTTANTSAIASMQIWNGAMSTQYYTTVSSPTGNNWVFSGGTGIPVTTSSSNYRVVFTAKDHSLTPGTYAVTGTVTAFTSGNSYTTAGSDIDSDTVTVDNSAPNSATSYSGTAGNASNTLNWTTSSSSDFNTTSGSVIYRWASGTAGSEVPVEGSTPSAGDINGTATAACVISSAASSAQSKVDGTGGSAGCTTTALTNGQQYIYKVFQKDNYGNYDTGVTIGPLTPTAGSATFTQNKYLWYVDNDLADPTAIWGNPDLTENQSIVVIPAGNDPPGVDQELRLRVNYVVNTTGISVSEKYFKLEYKVGTDGNCTTGSWTDVGTGDWVYATSTVTDGADITKVLSDTTVGKGEEYVKGKPSQVNHVAASAAEIIEYDFHIVGTSSTANTQYSFRVVETNSGGTSETVFDGYTNCPTLTTEPGTSNLLRHGNVFTEGLERGFFWTD